MDFHMIRNLSVSAGVVCLMFHGGIILAANSATVVSGTLASGSIKSTLGASSSYALETNRLDDWPLNTGAWGANVLPISLTNANYNGNAYGGTANTMIAFGDGGGVTLKFDQAIKPVAGEKEFGLFTAQMLASTGKLFNGNMEAAILVSSDNLNWRTLDGLVVTSPASYVATSYKLNAPTMAYDYVTTAQAWSYGTPGTTASNLALLDIADYQTPMIDDALFNGTATDAQRLALKTDSTTATYDSIFGNSAGGNWFDISSSGLSEVWYVRLNGVNSGGTSGGIRLDAVFTTVNAVPEPAAISLLVVGLAMVGRWRRASHRQS